VRWYTRHYSESGWQEATIVEEYPTLEHEDILACIRDAHEIVRSERVYSTYAEADTCKDLNIHGT